MKLKLPKWLRRETLQLPPWAVRSDRVRKGASIVIDVDTDGYIKEWLDLLSTPVNDEDKARGLTARPSGVVDQYWLEVAYQCAKLDVQAAIANTDHDPRTAGKHAEFRFKRAEQWALSKFATGKGIEAAAQGREARAHYVRIRGRLPF